jgi:hypothetical protein
MCQGPGAGNGFVHTRPALAMGPGGAGGCRPGTHKSLIAKQTVSAQESWDGHQSASGRQSVGIGWSFGGHSVVFSTFRRPEKAVKHGGAWGHRRAARGVCQEGGRSSATRAHRDLGSGLASLHYYLTDSSTCGNPRPNPLCFLGVCPCKRFPLGPRGPLWGSVFVAGGQEFKTAEKGWLRNGNPRNGNFGCRKHVRIENLPPQKMPGPG